MRNLILSILSLLCFSLSAQPAPRAAELLVPDPIKHAGLNPQEAVAAITLPPGFKATLFAGEPDIVQPVAFTFDDRGRLWVAEANNYPKKAPPGQGRDRILIFEDITGSGHFDKKTVFIEGLNLVSGIEYGFGGVWVGQAPELLFIPLLEGDKPGKPEVLLDGFAFNDTHETLNSLNWGPDGWLYGCHGVFNPSKVGKPGTPDKDRVAVNAAVWRFHPTKKIFEIFAEGGSNQWGIDWDEHGQLFMTCCVIPHLYHVIQGGRYTRQAGPHQNPYTFADLTTIADHRHYDTGARDVWAANGKSGNFGGGHAHAGAMIYQGDNFPPEYRGRLFMGNIHGNRINTDILEPKGSGFIAHHGPDFMLMNDSWSRIISMKTGPDGAMYVIDWYDKQACHLPKPEAWDRSNGRIFRVTYGDPKPVKVDLAKLRDDDLFDLQFHKNDWYVRHARRLLQERGSKIDLKKAEAIWFSDDHVEQNFLNKREHSSLHLLWLADALGEPRFSEQRARDEFFRNDHCGDAYIRAWCVTILGDKREQLTFESTDLLKAAKSDLSPIVRLQIASVISGLSIEQRWDILKQLVSHEEDASDINLPLMYWYAIEPCVAKDVKQASNLAIKSRIPLIRDFIARRLAMIADPPALSAAVSILDTTEDDISKSQALKGMIDGFIGKRTVPMPENWTAIYDELIKSPDAELKQRALAVATIFGDPRALAVLRKTLSDPSADLKQRQSAMDSLLAARDTATVPLLQQLLTDPTLRGGAIRGLAAYDDAKTPGLLLTAYPSFTAPEKLAALNTLAGRPAWATQLLTATQQTKIPAADLTAPTIRNLHSLGDPAINDWITQNWGSVRATASEKTKEIEKYKAILKPELLAKADARNGRALFTKTCVQCHTLFEIGAKIGPDLTGSNRANVDYLLENIIDPSAVIGKDYLMVSVKTKDGRFIDGIIKSQTGDSITFATVNELITLPKNEIASQKTSNVSMMPEGLMAGLSDKEVRDLIRYLGSPSQVEPAK